MKEKKPSRVYNEVYHKDAYVPAKEDVLSLIKKEEVNIYISERSKYSDGSEELKLVIKHK